MNELTALMTLGGMTIVAAVVIILRGIDTVEIVEARRRQQIGRIQELVGDMRAGQHKDRPSGRRPQL